MSIEYYIVCSVQSRVFSIQYNNTHIYIKIKRISIFIYVEPRKRMWNIFSELTRKTSIYIYGIDRCGIGSSDNLNNFSSTSVFRFRFHSWGHIYLVLRGAFNIFFMIPVFESVLPIEAA